MSERLPPRFEPEDLSVQLRRGQASRAEQQALARLMERDPTLALAHRVGLDFDRDTDVRPGDEELILRAADTALGSADAAVEPALSSDAALVQRAIDRALASAQERSPKAVHRPVWRLLAGIAAALALSFSGIGAALYVAGFKPPWQHAQPTHTEPATRAAKPRTQAPARPREEAKPTAVAPAVTPAPAVATAPAISAAPSVTPRSPRAHAPDAAGLFHAANNARRSGEFTRAKQLYTQLIERAPGSDEAHVAHVSLGKLLLSQGQAAAAERAFQRYLLSGGGPLAEEALFSRAQCFARLARVRDEQAAWRALLAAYPESVYTARAQERLRALAAP